MIQLRRLPLLLAAWVLVVAGTSAAIWFVIERAGAAVAPARGGQGTPFPALPASSATPTSSPSASVSPTARTSVTDSWLGAAGRVTVSCKGSIVTLQSASPADGYRLEGREGGGTHRLEVEFEGPRETKVTATCKAGAPVFASTSD